MDRSVHYHRRMTARREATERRRAALLRAAAREFAAAGYEGASLNRVIADAGMSKSSFYHFVGSKAELYDLVVAGLANEAAATLAPPPADAFAMGGFWARVDETLERFAGVAAQAPSLRLLGRLFYLQADDGVGARAALLGSVRAWVGDVLRAGRRVGAVRDDLPADVQADLVFAVLRVLDEWAVTESARICGGDGASVAGGARARVTGDLLRRMLAPS